MADSKNPPVLPEGYDPEREKANKGMAKYEAEQAAAQAKLDAQDEKAKNMGKSLMKFATDVLNKPQTEKKRSGGSVGYKAGGKVRGCGIARKGLTKGRMV